MTLHGLRSSCVSDLIHDNYDVKSVQDWVGHSDSQTTMDIYAKVRSEISKKEISDKMSERIKKNRKKNQ
ncbi:MAG: tyrosine-type recombinase/integrase [Lachnospiraceae bacterium]|nr:tyrosine-type recombinase/integrase [Lachnospiraceae bacterium]